MYLFFDTETTGLPKSWGAPVEDINNWPRLVQLGYAIYSEKGTLIEEKSIIIRPEGFVIPEEASRVHGVTTEKARLEGHYLMEVIMDFLPIIRYADHLVAHNMAFDEKIVGAEILRCKFDNLIPIKDRICTMNLTTDFCAIHSDYGYKWPKLQELHQKLFGCDFDGAHDALNDIRATAKCFWELKEKGIIKV